MLQQMRGLAKYIWVLVALFFVGGFLLYETSGLLGRTAITPTTAVAVVNGQEIPYNVYINRVQNEIQAAQQRNQGRSLTEDDNRQIENSVFDQMVAEILLNNEYRKRGIVVDKDALARGSPARRNCRPTGSSMPRSISATSAAPRRARAASWFHSSSTIAPRFRARNCSTRSLRAST